LTKDETVNLQSDAQSIQAIPTVVMLCMSGLINDFFGRKWFLFIVALGSTASYTLLPVVAPSKSLYIVLILGLNLFVLPLVNNTLI